MRQAITWLALPLVTLAGCARSDATQPDREPELVEPFASEGSADELEFSGRIAFANGGSIDSRAMGPTPLRPSRAGETGTALQLRLHTTGLLGLEAQIGLLPPLAAARQEVAHDMPGQPDDPRSRWTSVGLGEGEQTIELLPLGEDWHAPWALVVLEVRTGSRWLSAIAGPRSEMVRGGERVVGGRAILGMVPVERRPTRLSAVAVPEGSIVVDGALDEAAWTTREGAVLLTSREGEPALDIERQLGGPTRVWFAWDAQNLYVAGELPDHDLFAEQREQDDPIYRNEAFEVFVAGDGEGQRYLEFQISARNVTFDARFRSYRKGDEEWDGTWASAVQLDGELDRRGGDRGWTVELALPWSELCEHTTLRCPIEPARGVRVNVFRLDKPDRQTQVGLALSPTITPDFHAWANAAELVLEPSENRP